VPGEARCFILGCARLYIYSPVLVGSVFACVGLALLLLRAERPSLLDAAMASAKKLPLQERVPLARTAWKLADLAVLSLLLALLARRAATLLAGAAPSCTWCWLAALVCEAWFTVVWLLNVNGKWNPVRFDTHPERLAER
jgi:hypothetical protein